MAGDSQIPRQIKCPRRTSDPPRSLYIGDLSKHAHGKKKKKSLNTCAVKERNECRVAQTIRAHVHTGKNGMETPEINTLCRGGEAWPLQLLCWWPGAQSEVGAGWRDSSFCWELPFCLNSTFLTLQCVCMPYFFLVVRREPGFSWTKEPKNLHQQWAFPVLPWS